MDFLLLIDFTSFTVSPLACSATASWQLSFHCRICPSHSPLGPGFPFSLEARQSRSKWQISWLEIFSSLMPSILSSASPECKLRALLYNAAILRHAIHWMSLLLFLAGQCTGQVYSIFSLSTTLHFFSSFDPKMLLSSFYVSALC